MFFDNASTTRIDDKIVSNIVKLNNEHYYNAGALYSSGRESKAIISKAKDSIKAFIGAGSQDDLIFTGSATEANNLALFGFVKKNTKKILVSMGEHPSIYNVAMELKNRGCDVEFIKLDKNGKVDEEDFVSKLSRDVDLISVMHVSNETGAINDIARLVELAKDENPNVVFHCDGVQAVGKIDVDVDSLGVDLYTMSAHKIHGMKGVGALYVRKGVTLKPVIFGGGQEGGLRSGTENLLGIVSLENAVEMACSNIDKNYLHISGLKKLFLNSLANTGLKYVVHSSDLASPYIVSLSFVGVRAETLLNMLDDVGVMIGNGSACSSKNSGNRILEAMGVSKAEVESNVRISFSRFNTEEEVVKLVDCIKTCVVSYLQKV